MINVGITIQRDKDGYVHMVVNVPAQAAHPDEFAMLKKWEEHMAPFFNSAVVVKDTRASAPDPSSN